MKKIIVFALMLSIILCLPSCGNTYSKEFDTLNRLSSDIEYVFYTIDIETTDENGLTVKEVYNVTNANGKIDATYRIERLNSFTVDGNNIYLPTDHINVTEGTLSESAAGSGLALPKFNFSASSLSVTSAVNYGTYSYLTANITSMYGFMGLDFSGSSNHTLIVNYGANQINSLTISYTTDNGNAVYLTYVFQ